MNASIHITANRKVQILAVSLLIGDFATFIDAADNKKGTQNPADPTAAAANDSRKDQGRTPTN